MYIFMFMLITWILRFFFFFPAPGRHERGTGAKKRGRVSRLCAALGYTMPEPGEGQRSRHGNDSVAG